MDEKGHLKCRNSMPKGESSFKGRKGIIRTGN